MTERQRNWMGVAAISLAFGAGGAWGVVEFRIGKMEAELEVIRRDVESIICHLQPETIRCRPR